MRAGLQALQSEFVFQLIELDIDRHPELARRYSARIPVLELDGREVCHFFLDEQALRERLTAAEATRTGNPV